MAVSDEYSYVHCASKGRDIVSSEITSLSGVNTLKSAISA